ncbi:MAG: DUF1045 domain-containing protein [Pseudomonadota bacterium]
MRYAWFFMPSSDSALWQFGSAVLGYDAVTGDERDVPLRLREAVGADVMTDLTATPRTYGFHATLRAPFEPAAGVGETEVRDALAAFCARQPPVMLNGLHVHTLGAFIALTPLASSPALDALAADAVRASDALRAPLKPQDRARRMKAPLTPQQIAHLDRWGYPYVMDDFRFHMTLTGAIANDEQRGQVARALTTAFAPLEGPCAIDGIGLYAQADRASRFRVVERYALTG